MIKSFKCKATQDLFNGSGVAKWLRPIEKPALRKLDMLDYATAIQDLRVPPGNRLEVLRGSRKGQHSIRINDQWRICFYWSKDAAEEVEIVDYH
ncbi:MAG: type II toxin-antitoxin system RelE/ParE family toxin [Rhodospirillales bacterium]|nr:type II toxin-antitoxin system RelE/ParE family toxin [Rhodospirillales bacterium]